MQCVKNFKIAINLIPIWRKFNDVWWSTVACLSGKARDSIMLAL